MIAAHELIPIIGTAPACDALGLSRATFYRQLKAVPPSLSRPRPPSPRALLDEERACVMILLHCDRFVDLAPAEIYATLLDQGIYFCSERTMYRLLDEHQEVRERRRQLSHPVYSRPELLATAPNQVWSWDITKLRGPTTWTYYYLYVILDIFSRYTVGWMVADAESAVLARRLISDTCEKQGIEEGQLTVHADNGSSMTSKLVAQLMSDLGVTKTHSRPYVSDDNPYSESQFKTLKYRPDFPDRFESFQDARGFCGPFFHWYNMEHHHSGIGLMTPYSLHYGLAEDIRATRALALLNAYQAHPERFVHKVPQPPPLPVAAWINPPRNAQEQPEQIHPQSSTEILQAVMKPEPNMIADMSHVISAPNRPRQSVQTQTRISDPGA